MVVGIVTDSASDLPLSLADSLGVRIVRLEVRLAGHSAAELAEASGEQFWEIQRSSAELATTAAPSPGEFAQAYEELRDSGAEGVCCVTLSADLSATYQAALGGAGLVAGFPVELVDSRTVTMGEGNVVLAAADVARGGGDLAAVVAAARRASANSRVFGTLDTLENLRRGGRIGSAQALLGSLLSIKPVIEVRDGVVEGESKQRTRGRSFQYLVDKVAAAGPIERLAVVHAAAPDVDVIVEQLRPLVAGDDILVTSIGPVVGAHTGLGTVGVCWLAQSA